MRRLMSSPQVVSQDVVSGCGFLVVEQTSFVVCARLRRLILPCMIASVSWISVARAW